MVESHASGRVDPLRRSATCSGTRPTRLRRRQGGGAAANLNRTLIVSARALSWLSPTLPTGGIEAQNPLSEVPEPASKLAPVTPS